MSKETLNNGCQVTVTNSVINKIFDGINPVNWKTKNSGFSDQKKEFDCFFRLKTNTPTKVGTIKIEAPSGKKFSKPPGLIFKPSFNKSKKSKLTLKLKSIDKDADSNNIAYTFDMMYVAKENISKSGLLKYKIKSDLVDIIAKDTGVYRLNCGSKELNIFGENRQITIYGTPNSTFYLVAMKIVKSKDSNGNVLSETEESIIQRHVDPSANSPSYTPTNWSQNYNNTNINAVYGTIGSNGRYTFKQNFPGSTEETDYYVGIKSADYSSKFNSLLYQTRNSLSEFYFKKLTQYITPVLTLRLTTTQGAGIYSVDSNGDGTYETFNSGAPLDLVYKGYRKNISSVSNLFTVTYVVKVPSGQIRLVTGSAGSVSFVDGNGDTVSTDNTGGSPIFSNTTQSESDWTNSVATINGNTNINIYNIKSTLSDNNWDSSGDGQNDTLTLTFKVKVENWGSKNNTMALNLDSVIERF